MSNFPVTLRVEQACALLGVSRSTALKEINSSGTLLGLPVLRPGNETNQKRRIIIPTAPLMKALGITELPPSVLEAKR